MYAACVLYARWAVDCCALSGGVGIAVFVCSERRGLRKQLGSVKLSH